MKITNTGRGGRSLPIANGDYLMLAPGQSASIQPKDWDAIKDRDAIKADIADGVLAVSAEDGDAAPAAKGKKAAADAGSAV